MVQMPLIPAQTPETQTKTPFPFPDPPHGFHIEQCLPKIATQQNLNHSTVRIYANSMNLSTFPVTSVQPSIITVERAVLCQVFLETKYHKTFEQPSEREIRRETFESLVSSGKQLTTEQKLKFEQVLKSVESEWSRLSRVRPSIDAF